MTMSQASHPVIVIKYETYTDDYGQDRKTEDEEFLTEMAIYDYNNYHIENPKYQDIEKIGFTQNKTICIGDSIVDGLCKYRVKHVRPCRMGNEVFLIDEV